MGGTIRIGELPKSNHETVRVTLDRVQQRVVCDVRAFGPINKISNALTPLKNGFSFDPALIPQLCDLLQQAHERAVMDGLILGGDDARAS